MDFLYTKECKACKKQKPITYFYYHSKQNYAAGTCKRCAIQKTQLRRVPGSNPWKTQRYLKLKNNAKKRNIEFLLSKEHFFSIIDNKYCFYCECEPKVKTIDRVNNLVGYTDKNCVMACHPCNSMKGKLTKNDLERLNTILKKMSCYTYNNYKG